MGATIIVPLLIAFPFSLICSEMGSIFPQAGSTILWGLSAQNRLQQEYLKQSGRSESFLTVIKTQQEDNQDVLQKQQLIDVERTKQLKRRMTFQKIISQFYVNTQLLSILCGNALYGPLFCEYLEAIWPDLQYWYYKFIVSLLTIATTIILNLLGIEVVGWIQYVFVAVLLTPIAIYTIMAFQVFDVTKLTQQPKQVDLLLLLSSIIWSCTGFDQIANISGEVQNPAKSFPKALLIVIIATILSYLLPFLGSSMILPPDVWLEATFAQAAENVEGGGEWLAIWFVIAGAISALSVLNNSIACTSRELYCCAENGLIPFGNWLTKITKLKCKHKKQIRKQQKFEVPQLFADENEQNPLILLNTYKINDQYLQNERQQKIQTENNEVVIPYASILAVSIIPMALGMVSFDILVEIDSLFVITVMLMEISFYIVARHGKNRHRFDMRDNSVFRIKSGIKYTILVCAGPVVVGLVLLAVQTWYAYVVFVAFQLVIFSLSGLQKCLQNCKKKQKPQRASISLVYNSNTV